MRSVLSLSKGTIYWYRSSSNAQDVLSSVVSNCVTCAVVLLTNKRRINRTFSSLRCPELAEGRCRELADGRCPELAEGRCPELAEGRCPELAEGRCPELAEGRCPELAEGRCPELAEGFIV